MAPNSDKIRLRFSRADDNFCSRMVDEEEIPANAKQNTKPKKSSKGKEHAPNLSFLPVEILFYISNWLDSISLRNLSLTCRRLRDICFSMVACRGCVSPVWERQRAKGQRREKNIWEVVRHRRFFSSAMSPVDTWVTVNGSAIQKHLQR